MCSHIPHVPAGRAARPLRKGHRSRHQARRQEGLPGKHQQGGRTGHGDSAGGGIRWLPRRIPTRRQEECQARPVEASHPRPGDDHAEILFGPEDSGGSGGIFSLSGRCPWWQFQHRQGRRAGEEGCGEGGEACTGWRGVGSPSGGERSADCRGEFSLTACVLCMRVCCALRAVCAAASDHVRISRQALACSGYMNPA